MPQSAFLQSLIAGTASQQLRLAMAQGLVPVPPSEILVLLVHLLTDSDGEIAAQAGATLAGWSQEDIVAQLTSRECGEAVLLHFAATTSSAAVQEAIILNPASPGQAIAALAGRVPPALMEMILYNRVRLIEFPEIINKLKSNPAITNQIQVTLQDVEAEFFTSKKTEYQVEEEERADAAEEVELALEEDLSPSDLSLEGLPTDPRQREAVISTQLSRLKVQDKLRLGLQGTREVRAVLIRDANRQVARNVLESPKLTDSEVESFAAMRTVSEEILREIGIRREWTRSYGVVLNLVRNPRTPPMISQNLLARLRSRDLALIARDHGVPEGVRCNAQRALTSRNPAHSPARG